MLLCILFVLKIAKGDNKKLFRTSRHNLMVSLMNVIYISYESWKQKYKSEVGKNHPSKIGLRQKSIESTIQFKAYF